LCTEAIAKNERKVVAQNEALRYLCVSLNKQQNAIKELLALEIEKNG